MISGHRRYRLPQLFSMLLAMSVLGACTTETLDPRGPSAIKNRTQVTTDRFGVCWPFDFDRSVPANPVPAAADQQFIAGYNNHIRPGQSCNTQESFAYTGAVYVNLAGVHNVVVTNATLKFDRADTPVPIRVVRDIPGGIIIDRHCSLNVEIATEDWRSSLWTGTNFVSRPIPTHPPVTMAQDRFATTAEANVTWAVQQWALGRIPDFGLVIKPQPEDIGKNENTCTGYLSNPRLEITIARRAE